MTDSELISAAIEASGLSARRFAVEILARDERTIRRWLIGDPIPATARSWLERFLALPAIKRRTLMMILAA